MVKLIGKKGCMNCMVAKKKLEREGVEFEYLDLQALDNQDEIIANARKKGVFSLPIAMVDDEIVDLKTILK